MLDCSSVIDCARGVAAVGGVWAFGKNDDGRREMAHAGDGKEQGIQLKEKWSEEAGKDAVQAPKKAKVFA